MTDREREDVLLNQAVKRGLLDAEDVSTLRSMPPKVGSTLRYGPRLDRLVEQGKLSEGQLERLSAELTAFERTLDGRAESIPSVPQLEKVSVQLPPWLAQWSQYEVLGLLGQGGMGMVYRARDRRLSREVALKFISVTDDQLRKRFLTEARAQARLNHEFICKVFEVGEVQGHPYIAMELVQGKPLSTIHRSLNREQKLTLVRDISHAVHTAHSLGIIHRVVVQSANRRQALLFFFARNRWGTGEGGQVSDDNRWRSRLDHAARGTALGGLRSSRNSPRLP